MPYIKMEDRQFFDREITLLSIKIGNEGDFNYCITKLALLLLKKWGKKYGIFNLLIGVFECAKLELYRRHVGIYEDEKIQQNGDVL